MTGVLLFGCRCEELDHGNPAQARLAQKRSLEAENRGGRKIPTDDDRIGPRRPSEALFAMKKRDRLLIRGNGKDGGTHRAPRQGFTKLIEVRSIRLNQK